MRKIESWIKGFLGTSIISLFSIVVSLTATGGNSIKLFLKRIDNKGVHFNRRIPTGVPTERLTTLALCSTHKTFFLERLVA